jgi:hypothetical protein
MIRNERHTVPYFPQVTEEKAQIPSDDGRYCYPRSEHSTSECDYAPRMLLYTTQFLLGVTAAV